MSFRLNLSFTERRRRKLALKVATLDRLENRSTVTPIGAAAVGLGLVPAMGQADSMRGWAGGLTP
jgi:hypothetical protein